MRAFYHRCAFPITLCVFCHTVRFPITGHSDVTITVYGVLVTSFRSSFLPSFHHCVRSSITACVLPSLHAFFHHCVRSSITACILPSLCAFFHHCVRSSITVCILPSLRRSVFQPVLSAVQASRPASGTDPTFLDGAGRRGV